MNEQQPIRLQHEFQAVTASQRATVSSKAEQVGVHAIIRVTAEALASYAKGDTGYPALLDTPAL